MDTKTLIPDESVSFSKNPNNYHELNAMLALTDASGKFQFEKDKEAAKEYFLQHVNPNTMFFHDLEEKLQYLVKEEYYEEETFKKYKPEFVKNLFKQAYEYKFRFPTFLGAFKFYSSYALKTFDGKRYLERFEDRVVMNALYLSEGNETMAKQLVDEIISGRYQPATPTFLNAGKRQRGELVSCFLLRIEDNMESIGRSINSALQLSKRGGGVALCLTNIRETGSPIKKIKGQSSGVIPVMKMLEDAFSYANQLGSRDGAGAVYIHAHHPDIMAVLDTKRENADEKVRIKTLSLGVVIPDVTFELAKTNSDMYLFSPYDIKRVYGVDFTDLNITEKYQELVNDSRITKKKLNARVFLSKLAEIQFQSGYPYIMFEDNVNRPNPIKGKISMSNLCSEILQISTPTEYNEDLTIKKSGIDISCNLGSMNVAKAMESPDFGRTVETAIRALTAVSNKSNIKCVPSIHKGNSEGHAIGLGQMNLHGFFGKEKIYYGSPESIEFTDAYFRTVLFYALKASNKIAKETEQKFKGFEDSTYATGEFFDKYTSQEFIVTHPQIKKILTKYKFSIPTVDEWNALKKSVMKYGLYNRNLQAIPPTGSISYINNSTSSIHPIASRIEKRKEGKLGTVFYPSPHLTDENKEYFQDAYEIGPQKIIDVYAAAQQHVDQGMSLTLFFPSEATTRDINKAQGYAWAKQIKTLYYIRTRQKALEGTEVKECTSCSL